MCVWYIRVQTCAQSGTLMSVGDLYFSENEELKYSIRQMCDSFHVLSMSMSIPLGTLSSQGCFAASKGITLKKLRNSEAEIFQQCFQNLNLLKKCQSVEALQDDFYLCLSDDVRCKQFEVPRWEHDRCGTAGPSPRDELYLPKWELTQNSDLIQGFNKFSIGKWLTINKFCSQV